MSDLAGKLSYEFTEEGNIYFPNSGFSEAKNQENFPLPSDLYN